MRMLCAIALMFVGFAHQPPAYGAEGLAQYRLPDGTVPVLCVTYKGADGKQHSKTHAPGCEACRIAAAVMLPEPPTDVSEVVAFVRPDVPVPDTPSFHRQLYPPNTGPRAPPAFA
jgi:hypothetical protein